MKLFLIGTPEDASYLETLRPFVRGIALKFKLGYPAMYNELLQWIRSYDDSPASPGKLDGIIVTNDVVLEMLLHAQLDFRPPPNNKKLTLDDYQGSLLDVRVGDRVIPAVILNPLQHLYTVPYGKFLTERFISKITSPEKWLPDIEFKWKLVEIQDAETVVARLAGARVIAADIETPTQGEWAELRGINCVGYAGLFLCGNEWTIECYVFPFHEEFYSAIRAINDSPVPKVTQNGLYDNLYFLRWGVPVRCWYWDTYHLFHSWLAELPKNLALVSAFAVRKIRYWKDDGKSGNLEDYYRYNAKDCWATLCALLSLLRDAPEWAITNYVEHEFPCVFPAITCELEGFDVDKQRFDELYNEKLATKESELQVLRTMVGEKEYNPNSSQQNLKVFTILGCGSLGSTDKAATLKARAAHPLNDLIIGAITDWKSNAKALSNYLNDNKLWEIAPGRFRLFYKLDPGGTDSGRFASKASSFWCGFQIQNVSAKDPTIKSYFRADFGWLLGEGDFAQSEARCVGYLSGETALIDVVEGPNDYHAWNASQFFGVSYERIYDNEAGKTTDKPLRDLSKRTNHGANYNMGPGVMLDTMGPKYVSEAKRLLRLPPKLSLRDVCAYLLSVYEKTYPRVKKDWYESVVKTVTISGMLVSPLGWTRRFFGKPLENKHIFNSVVAHSPQNLSVGIINKCFVRLWKDQMYGDLRGKLRLKAQIHDAILFQYRIECPEVPGIVRERMRYPVEVTDCFGTTRTMLIPPDMSAGKVRWSELK